MIFMTDFEIAADNINGKEQSYMNTIKKALTDKGHTVNLHGVGPNVIQQYALGGSSKGKVCVQVVGGLDGWTAADMVTGIKNGYYHCSKFMIVGSSAFTGNSNLASSAYTSKHMKRAHDAGATLQNVYTGMTPKEFNEKYKQYFKFCLGDTLEEAIEQMLGDVTDSTSKSSGGDSSSTYADMIKDLVKPWDKEVEIVSYDCVVRIDRTFAPSPVLWVREGVNLVSDSLTVTSYNPDTVNKLGVNYNGKSITVSDELLIDCFDENLEVEDAKFTKNNYSRVEDFTFENKSPFEWESSALSTGFVSGMDGSGKKEKYSTKLKAQDKITCTSEEVDIKTPKEAKEFALRHWGMWRRSSGFKIECKVIGYAGFTIGNWCYVCIPSLDIDEDLYITKVDHTFEGGEWITGLTLECYPSSFGSGESNKVGDDKSDNTEDKDKSTDDSSNDKTTA